MKSDTLTFPPLLQKTTEATEAMYLMMEWAFESGYRRYEWKCDSLNLASRRAAQRLGLSYEECLDRPLSTKEGTETPLGLLQLTRNGLPLRRRLKVI